MKKLRILTARFAGTDRDSIIVEYGIKYPGDAKERRYKEALTYDSSLPAVQKVLEKFPVIKLEENYILFQRQELDRKTELDNAITMLENDEWDTFQRLKKAGIKFNVVENEISEIEGTLSFKNIMATNKDTLFKIKLEILGQDFIKDELKKPDRPGQSHETPKSKKRKELKEFKGKIRKSKTLIEVLYHFWPIYKASLAHKNEQT